MNDRELLELAAKAAGYDLYATWSEFGYFEGFRIGSIDGDAWNPLTDDGDALRLAVKLGLAVNCYTTSDCVADGSAAVEIYTPELADCVRESATKDANTATRRAIVRAAAEIGKGMVAQPSGKDLPEDDYYKSQAEAFYGGKP